MARLSVAVALLLCVAAVSARELQQWKPSFAAQTSSSGSSSGGSWQPGKTSGAGGLENYQQCGGMGGACEDAGNTCVDAPFPGKRCPADATCVRNTAYHWMCRPQGDSTNYTGKKGDAPKGRTGRTGSSFSGPGGYTIPGTDAQVKNLDVSDDGVIRRWKQCGGNTGKCKSYGDNACRDCAFAGTSCEEGHVCARILEGFWQCAPDDRFKAGPKCKPLKEEEDLAPAPAPAEEEEDVEVDDEEADAKDAGMKAEAVPAADKKDSKCKAPVARHEVDGKYLETVYLKDVDRKLYYSECCASCSTFPGCVAFQINVYATNASTCDMFSEFKEVVPGSATSIAGIMNEIEPAAAVAGK
jgi:hypothetical protein